MTGPAEGWSQELADEVFVRLRWLDELAAGVLAPTVDVEQIRAETKQMIAAWRRLVEQHQPVSGRCLRCRGWAGRRRWPCPVWKKAHALLIEYVEPSAPSDQPVASTAWLPDRSLSRPLGARIPPQRRRKSPADPDPRVMPRAAAPRPQSRGAVARGSLGRHARAES